MARIYFNCPNLQWIQWNKITHSFSTRQITASILVSVLLLLLLFIFIEYFVISRPHVYEKSHTHTYTHSFHENQIDFGPNVHYGIVIDCGSSGSRIFVYFWPQHSGNPQDLLNIQQLMDKNGNPVVKKITPGLDTFKDNPEAASDYIKPLLNFASKYIPKHLHKETLLFILATAGMRMIPEKSQKLIFDNLITDLRQDFDFVISESNFEVISGKLEGVYAWIAVNYVLKKFDHGEEDHPLVAVEMPEGENENRTHVRRRTVGMIDMGGGSMQIAFEITSKFNNIPKPLIAEFNLGCQNSDLDHTYRVYVTTFLGFGANEARERYEAMLISKVNNSVQMKNESMTRDQKIVIEDPCLPVGLIFESENEGQSLVFHGSGNYTACQNAVIPLLHLNSECKHEPCSMEGIHQPEISLTKNEFYGFSEFWYTMQDVFRIGGSYSSKNFDDKASEFCSTDWMTLLGWYRKKLFPKADKNRFRLQCFKAAWMSSVLHKGLNFPKSYKLFHSVQLINNKEVQWTLGALIHRTRYLPLREVKSFESQSYRPPWRHKTAFMDNQYIIILCFIVVFTAILLYMKRLRLCPRRSDMTRVPSMSYFMVDADDTEQGSILLKNYP